MLQVSYLGSSKGKVRGIALGKFPYTYARVSVMRSFLLKKDDYQRLMKMDASEIASYLQGSQYKGEIDELGVKFKGIQLLELALNRNLANTWAKLKRISPPSLRAIITIYLLKADIWNLKTLIRARYTGLAQGELQAMLLPSGFLNMKKLDELSKKESIEEILKSAGFVGFRYFASAVDRFRETKSISDIENALDLFYYSSMKEFSGRIPREGGLFREFVEYELEASAIINVLRLKRAGMPSKEIEKFMVIPGTARSLLTGMINAPSPSDAAKALEQSRFRPVVEAGVSEFLAGGSLIRLELDLARNVLKHSALLIHRHPLSVDTILGYMFAKEIEVRNLKLMLKAKKLGMGMDFVEQQLIAV